MFFGTRDGGSTPLSSSLSSPYGYKATKVYLLLTEFQQSKYIGTYKEKGHQTTQVRAHGEKNTIKLSEHGYFFPFTHISI